MSPAACGADPMTCTTRVLYARPGHVVPSRGQGLHASEGSVCPKLGCARPSEVGLEAGVPGPCALPVQSAGELPKRKHYRRPASEDLRGLRGCALGAAPSGLPASQARPSRHHPGSSGHLWPQAGDFRSPAEFTREGPGTFSQNELLRSLAGRSARPRGACSAARGLTFRAAG